jgi:bifunctional UDP-N-acetylglucosamine pyrophosphorylase / glucosamine-1-phosphate N-acetyltransferase
MAESTALHVLVLAGGNSTRTRTGGPKALLDLCGLPLLEHVFRAVDPLQAGEHAIVLGPTHREPIEAWMRKAGRHVEAGGAWKIALQPEARGTGDAVACGLSQLPKQGRLLILCGDTPLLTTDTLRALTLQDSDALLTALCEDPTGYGRVLYEEDGRVMRIVEEADADEEIQQIGEINAGVYLLDIAALRDALQAVTTDNVQGEFYLPDAAVAILRSREGVCVCLEDGENEILGVNTLQQLATAQFLLRDRRLDELMTSGVIIDDPATTFVEYDVEIGPDTRIHPCCVIRAGVKIGAGCEVGPFAQLRVGTQMHDGSVIGNFVETKNTELESGAKAKHLTYLGDAHVGAKANIGCGTITANYDGKNKHRTEIGAGAFIGSGTVLVAPVRIGAGAMTAAGSVVLKGRHVDDGEVVGGVPARPLKSVE